MNRDIEFRGMHSNKWLYGYLVKSVDDNKYYITVSTDQFYQVKEETIGQYTGLKDKNGKKIFEGDIVESEYRIFKSTVEWNDSFCGFFPFCNTQTGIFADECEVIGNIYEENLESKGE